MAGFHQIYKISEQERVESASVYRLEVGRVVIVGRREQREVTVVDHLLPTIKGVREGTESTFAQGLEGGWDSYLEYVGVVSGYPRRACAQLERLGLSVLNKICEHTEGTESASDQRLEG